MDVTLSLHLLWIITKLVVIFHVCHVTTLPVNNGTEDHVITTTDFLDIPDEEHQTTDSVHTRSPSIQQSDGTIDHRETDTFPTSNNILLDGNHTNVNNLPTSPTPKSASETIDVTPDERTLSYVYQSTNRPNLEEAKTETQTATVNSTKDTEPGVLSTGRTTIDGNVANTDAPEPEVCYRYGRLLSTLDLCWSAVTDFSFTRMRIGTYLPIIRISQYENETEIFEELQMYCSTYIRFMGCVDVGLRNCHKENTLRDRLRSTGERACSGSDVKLDLRHAISAHFDASLSDRLTCIDDDTDMRYSACVRREADLLHGLGLNMMKTELALQLLHDSYQRSLSCLFTMLWDQSDCHTDDVDFLLQTALLSLPAGIHLTKEDVLQHTN